MRSSVLDTGVNPFWGPLAMVLTQDMALHYLRGRTVLGSENLPQDGPVLLAPTHRARWDALMIPMAAGRRITGRDCRFMVTRTEMSGLQGWFLHRLGCFAIDQDKPSLTTLRFALDLLEGGQQLVVFPEGRIKRTDAPIALEQGSVRLAQLAHRRGINVQVVPVGLAYNPSMPGPRSRSAICFEKPLIVDGKGKQEALRFNRLLAERMHTAEQAARESIGRPLNCP